MCLSCFQPSFILGLVSVLCMYLLNWLSQTILLNQWSQTNFNISVFTPVYQRLAQLSSNTPPPTHALGQLNIIQPSFLVPQACVLIFSVKC